jgi:membrane fusion protein (multidrug efflux system)
MAAYVDATELKSSSEDAITMNAISKTAQADPALAPASKPAMPVRKRRLWRPVAAIVVLIGIALIANWWFTEAVFIESTDNAYIQGDIAVLGPRIDGDVISVEVGDNQAVKTGDRLVVLDPRDRQAQLAVARASEAEASSAIATTQRQVEQQRASIATADAMIASADAEQTRAVAEAGRTGALVGAGWTSRQANEVAVADRAKARAMVANAAAGRENALRTLAVAEAQQAQAEARLLSAQAQVRIAENNLSYTVMTAPSDGIVGNRAVRVGTHVAAGQQLLALTPPASSLYVLANFKETQLIHMQPGQSVILTPDIDTNAAVHGRVASMAPATGALFSLLPPENATGNFTKVVQRVPVKLAIDPVDAGKAAWLRAGLSVTADVDTRKGDHPRLGIIGAALATLGLR